MCEEGYGGCGMWLEMRFMCGYCQSETFGGELQLCGINVPAWLYLEVRKCLQLVLSH